MGERKGKTDMPQPEILIADDHALLIEAFKNLLEPEFRVVGSATDGHTLLELARSLRPDVIILDIGLPVMNGIDAGRILKDLLPQSRLIVVTMYEDLEIAGEAMRHWASGYLLKTSAGSELTRAVREVLRGHDYVTPRIARRLGQEFIRDPHLDRTRTLTPRQREVLQLMAKGLTMRQAAEVLHVTPRTVAFHKYRIMEEFGLKNSSDLVRFAIKEQLIPGGMPNK
jgi:DNA-binding NarL/FixJ family response regulator